jgi:hypothetical protein
VLATLEGEQLTAAVTRGRSNGAQRKPGAPNDQLGLFAAVPNPIVDRLAALDTDAMTPLQALTTLAELAREAKRA